MKAIILAGGAGSRLRPLTCTLPKPMVPVMNLPVMEYTLRLLRRHGIREVTVTLQYLPNRIRSYFRDGEELGMKISYCVEEKPLGTAGSVLLCGADRERTLVLSGDALTDLDLGKLLAFHEERGGAATLVLKQVEKPLEYGVALTDGQGRIERFLEKPDWSEAFSDRANTGIYVLEPEMWEGFSAGSAFDFAKDVFPKAMERGKELYGFLTEDYWCDIGSVEEYIRAHRDIFEGKCTVELPNARYEEGCWFEEGVRLDRGCVLRGPCYLGAGVEVQNGAAIEAYTVLGTGVAVKEGASVKRSILWEGAEVGRYSELRGAVLCAGVTVGNRASVFESAVAAENVRLGDRSIVRGGVRLWPEKSLPAGTAAGKDCIWNAESEGLFAGCETTGGTNELPAEVCCRLGRAVGTAAGEGGRIAMATDGAAAAVMARQAFAAGAMEAGCDLYDLERAVLPVLRFGTRLLHASAAMYFSVTAEGRLRIRLLDGRGCDAGKAAVRQVQTAFEQGGRRVGSERLGLLAMRGGMEQLYCADLYERAEGGFLRERGGFAACAARGMEAEMLRLLFGSCGWSAAIAEDGREAERLARKRQGIALGMEDGRLSVYRGDGGERLHGPRLELLCAAVDLLGGEKVIWTDALSGEAMERLAKRHGARVERLPERELQRTLEGKNTLLCELRRDPYATALLLCGRLARLGRSVEQVAAELPLPQVRERTVAVTWKDIGRIFRTVAEESAGRTGLSADLTEGVRVSRGDGWVNLLPDAGGRCMRVIGQAFSEEYAQSLADFYGRRVERIIREKKKKQGEKGNKSSEKE